MTTKQLTARDAAKALREWPYPQTRGLYGGDFRKVSKEGCCAIGALRLAAIRAGAIPRGCSLNPRDEVQAAYGFERIENLQIEAWFECDGRNFRDIAALIEEHYVTDDMPPVEPPPPPEPRVKILAWLPPVPIATGVAKAMAKTFHSLLL